jgi:hypothetical protein
MIGSAVAPTPPAAVGLSSLRWDGWLRRNDMQLYSNGCIRERKSGLETDLTAALVSELGGWDPALCEYLADFELCKLIQPTQLLEQFASERDWSFEPGPYDEKGAKVSGKPTLESRHLTHRLGHFSLASAS